MTRPAKKSETIEIRVSHAAKSAFIERCREDRQTASEAIRGFIDAQIESPPRRRLAAGWRLPVAGLLGAALGVGVAAPSFARTEPDSRAAFEQRDANHDGVLDYREFRAR